MRSHAVARPLVRTFPVIARLLGMLLASMSVASTARAQSDPPSCHLLCSPSVTFMPAAIRSHLFGGPEVRATGGGPTHRLASTTNLELIFAVAAKTAVPRLSLFGSVQWLPNASDARNPFTLYTAPELGEHVRANAPTATFGASVAAITAASTKGWVDLAANVADLYSQAARPGDASAYTHKLDLELITHEHVFAAAPPKTYLHGVTLFAILDFVATGLPRAGDEVPVGRTYASDARPTSLIAGLALPIIPAPR